MTAATAAPPIQHFEHWTLVTADLERSKWFYTEVLGGSPRQGDGPDGVNLAGTIIDLFPDRGGEHQAPTPSMGYHHAYVIRLEDFDSWIEHLRRHEVPMRTTTHGTDRMSVYIEDPDGHRIELTVPFDDPEVWRQETQKRGIVRPPRGARD